MKFVFFFLSFYVLYLSSLPCGDSRECNEKNEVKISALTNHHAHDHNDEACTPFCTCSCCSVSVLYVLSSKEQTSKPASQSEKYPFYDISCNTKVYYTIWQPPKIS